jgi:hypothetical protein
LSFLHFNIKIMSPAHATISVREDPETTTMIHVSTFFFFCRFTFAVIGSSPLPVGPDVSDDIAGGAGPSPAMTTLHT